VSSSLNRSSITAHGLDSRRMAATRGIAAGSGRGGPYRPELEAVFLCETLDMVGARGSDRYATLAGRVAEVVDRVAAAEAGFARLAAVYDEVSFGARVRSGTWRLDAESAALLERVGAAVEISVGASSGGENAAMDYPVTPSNPGGR
jgi:hypothetical protein